jgi:predicted kinase
MAPAGSVPGMPTVPLLVPRPALLLLVGVAGCGKSTFAARHFAETEVVSSDRCRALVADDPNDQAASADAFAVLHLLVRRRLKRRHLVTAVDATSLRRRDRRPFVRMAQAAGTPAVAVVLDLPLEVCVARDRARRDRTVGADTLERMHRALHRSLPDLAEEGFSAVYHLRAPEEVDAVALQRVPFQPALPLPPGHPALSPAPSPRTRPRIASTIRVTGWLSAKTRSQSGIVSVGTNAEEAKTSGKIHTNPAACAASAPLTDRPMLANTHDKREPEQRRRSRTRRGGQHAPRKRNPMSVPTR